MESTKKDWIGLISQLEEKLDQLKTEFHTLEVQARIDLAAGKARRRPESLPDEPDEGFSDAEGLRRMRKYIRGKIRDLYFSVSDKDLRIRLITTHRRIEHVECQLAENEVEWFRFLVDREVLRAERSPWMLNAVVGMVFVALGYSGFGMLGAICGAVFGIFVGQEGIRRYYGKSKELPKLQKRLSRARRNSNKSE